MAEKSGLAKMESAFERKSIVTAEDVISMMLRFVRAYLALDNIVEEKRGQEAVVFSGTGKDGLQYALEVVTRIDKAASFGNLQRRIDKRTKGKKPGAAKQAKEELVLKPKRDRIYTAFLFPASIETEALKIETPYRKRRDLLRTACEDHDLAIKYQRFSHKDILHLSDAEFRVALPYGKSRIAYYRLPQKRNSLGEITVSELHRFPDNEIIPADRPLRQRYFWGPARINPYPSQSLFESYNTAFKGIQEGLHDRVRHIHLTEIVRARFTLEANDADGANLVELPPQVQQTFGW